MPATAKWRCKSLGDAQTAFMDCRDIAEVFEELFETAGRPQDMAVFVRNDSEGRLHCEVTVFFSPATQALAKRYQAATCEKPSVTGLDLLAGDPACWPRLFPEADVPGD